MQESWRKYAYLSKQLLHSEHGHHWKCIIHHPVYGRMSPMGQLLTLNRLCRDTDKCTFILLDPSIPGHHGGAMAGDVNVFLTDPEDPHLAEIEV